MRVIQVNKFHFLQGGAERYYRDVSLALSRRGVAVNHLSMEHPRNWPAESGDLFVRRVEYRDHLGAGRKLQEALRTIHNRQAAVLARSLARNGERPVVHLHNIYHQLSPSVISAFAHAGVPMVQTVHDYKLICPAYLLLTEGEICERCRGGKYLEAVRHRCLLQSRGASVVGALEAYVHQFLGTYGRIQRFLCPSRFLLEKLASFGLPREKLIHFPYFLPLGKYRPAAVPAGGKPLGCLYLGRLSREKGIGTLIDAMAQLPPGRLRLLVLGEGPLRPALEEKVRQTCADGRVEFGGYRSGEELLDTIRGAAFTVVPSEWYENLPFAVLEAFALGKPVVGASIGGIPELVLEGKTGRLFLPGSAESLAKALLWMSGPDADLEDMGNTARILMEREYGEEAHVERLLALYAEASA